MGSIATHFAVILAALRAAVAAHAARKDVPAHAARKDVPAYAPPRNPRAQPAPWDVPPPADPLAHSALFVLVWARLSRTATRFANLFARFRAGTLPQPRPARPGRIRAPRPKPFFPTRRAWLVVAVRDTASLACQLQNLLAHPDLAEFLRAAPQAGRILRPLCHMLGIPRPAALQPPPIRPPPIGANRAPAHPAAAPLIPQPSLPPPPGPARRFSPT